MNLILLGAPGAGKGTQAEIISKKYNLFHVSTGNLFRKALEEGKELGKLAKSYMDRGELVPDDIVLKIVIQNLPQNSGCLFDGFPRNAAQAQSLDVMLKEQKKTIDAVINVKVEPALLIERMIARGRSDDNIETIKNRFRVYKELTTPLILYYFNQGKLKEINGNGSVEEVTRSIEEVLKSL